MLLKLKVTPSKGNAGKQIERLAAKLSDAQKLNAAVGRGFERTLRRHFRELDKRPNRRGWRKSRFWEKIAADTVFAGADESKAVVAIGNSSGSKLAAKVFGARIRPKGGKKFLAIPAIEARYGVSPSSLDKSELQFRRTRRGGLLGVIRADGTMQVHYWLVRKADTPRDPDALPKKEAVLADAKKEISKYLKIK